jgi:flagellar biosynthetic protein FliR
MDDANDGEFGFESVDQYSPLFAMSISGDQIVLFFLIFARLLGLIQQAPLFNNKDIFALAKLALVVWVSMLCVFLVPTVIHLPQSLLELAPAVVVEFLVGAVIGYVMQLIIISVEFAGSLIDNQAGLSASSVLDPSSGQSNPVLTRLMTQVATIAFVVVNGHLLVLRAILESFKILPVGSPIDIPSTMEALMVTGQDIFSIGLQIAMPVILVIFLTDFALGLVNRVAPQVNVFQLGFQIKPIVAVLVMLFAMPVTLELVTSVIQKMTERSFELMIIMRGVHG